MKKKLILAVTASMVAASLFSGCTSETTDTSGSILLSVNPEIRISYDRDGLVTEILGVNEDGKDIVSDYDNYIGKECREVVSELVEEIHEAGYFVEEVEDGQKKIVIELEEGSEIPDDDFLDEIGEELKNTVAALDFGTTDNEADSDYSDDIIVEVKPAENGNSDYGESSYDTNDGNSDYSDDNVVIEIPVTTTSADNSESDYGASDYDTQEGESDYTPSVTTTAQSVVTDGNSDYDDSSDYGASDYDTDDSNSDYGASDYDTDDSNSDYDASDYDTDDSNSDYGVSDYDTDDSNSDYDDGESDYIPAVTTSKKPVVTNGNSDYGNSDYDDGESDYRPVQTSPPATQAPAVNGNSDYGNSDYGDSNYSDYGNSDYDD